LEDEKKKSKTKTGGGGADKLGKKRKTQRQTYRKEKLINNGRREEGRKTNICSLLQCV
jgi:hypothetical protein